MNYNDFKNLCDQRKVQVNDITCHIKMTYQGLKAGLNSGKLGSNKVLELCEVLDITPNAFFGYEPVTGYNGIASVKMQLRTIEKQLDDLRELLLQK